MRKKLQTAYRKDVFVGFRATERQMARLTDLAQQTGLNLSGVLRALIDAADAEPERRMVPVVRVAGIEQGEVAL